MLRMTRCQYFKGSHRQESVPPEADCLVQASVPPGEEPWRSSLCAEWAGPLGIVQTLKATELWRIANPVSVMTPPMMTPPMMTEWVRRES